MTWSELPIHPLIKIVTATQLQATIARNKRMGDDWTMGRPAAPLLVTAALFLRHEDHQAKC